MLEIVKTIRQDELQSPELRDWLYNFYSVKNNVFKPIPGSFQSLISKYRQRIINEAPTSPEKSLFFIRKETGNFPYYNDIWKYWLQVIWPLFFEKFPEGEIWIVRIHEDWFTKMWQSQRKITNEAGAQDIFEIFAPHEASGLSADLFPLIALNLLSFSIYPLVLCDYVYISTSNVSHSSVIYIPDRIIKYDYSYESRGIYFEILFKFVHIYNDQWTFDGRGSTKSLVSINDFETLQPTSYFEEVIRIIGQRMKDIISISDPWNREILGMTINRAICDAIICSISFLPYVAKVFFFNTLDKLSNIIDFLNLFGNAKNEIEIWKQLLKPDFLEKEVLNVINRLPSNPGKFLRSTVEFAIDKIRNNSLTPDFFRFIRNTHHGYFLKNRNLKKLLTSPGEFNNDITLLSIPLIMYLLSLSWVKSNN